MLQLELKPQCFQNEQENTVLLMVCIVCNLKITFPALPSVLQGCVSLIPGSRVGGCSQQRIHPATPWHVLGVWDDSVGVELYLSGDLRWFGVVKATLLPGNEAF